jgi:hypothetical protein
MGATWPLASCSSRRLGDSPPRDKTRRVNVVERRYGTALGPGRPAKPRDPAKPRLYRSLSSRNKCSCFPVRIHSWLENRKPALTPRSHWVALRIREAKAIYRLSRSKRDTSTGLGIDLPLRSRGLRELDSADPKSRRCMRASAQVHRVFRLRENDDFNKLPQPRFAPRDFGAWISRHFSLRPLY